MDREGVTVELLELVDSIKTLTLNKQRLDRRSRKLRREFQEVVYRTSEAIYHEVNDKGKLSYSNEERRRGELSHRFRQDPEATAMQEQMAELDNEVGELVAEINRLQDRKVVLLVAMGAPLPEDTIESGDRRKYFT